MQIYTNISSYKDYETAVGIWEEMFAKKNSIFAYQLLATRQLGVNLKQYLQALKTLSHDYNFKLLTVE